MYLKNVCFCFTAYQPPRLFNAKSSFKKRGNERSVMLEFICRKTVSRKNLVLLKVYLKKIVS